MKIHCKCGAVIADQSDFLSSKAYLITDQDWFDFVDSTTKNGEIDFAYVRHCYQCSDCGRLYVDDSRRHLQSFVPEEAAHNTLLSIKGTEWRAPLIGTWTDNPISGQSNGNLWCWGNESVCIDENFDDWEQLQATYFELFRTLRTRDLLRSAYLRRGSDAIHSWAFGDRA